MLMCYVTTDSPNAIPLSLIAVTHFSQWFEAQTTYVKNWVKANAFAANPESICLIPNAEGHLSEVLVGIHSTEDYRALGDLSRRLPIGDYRIANTLSLDAMQAVAVIWGLGAYQFTRYKKPKKTIAKLVLPEDCHPSLIQHKVEAAYLGRTLINTPAEDMGPSEVAEAVIQVGKQFGAQVEQIVGDALIEQHYPAIHAVGRASTRAPRLIELRWGDPTHPKITLVGKGVCFDTGGLDLKSASGMALMKKDMAGAAHVLALGRLIMAEKLNIYLRILIPAVENVVSGNAYRPGDVIMTRKGLSVEIGNTDAEGRVILADALTRASEDDPDLIIDFATLTGAARIAVGADISALFTDNDELANAILSFAHVTADPMWRLPLYTPYRKLLDSSIADINNASTQPLAGATLAGLFLREFVADPMRWIHFDIMAWNNSSSPGHPEGGEVMGLWAVYHYLCHRYARV